MKETILIIDDEEHICSVLSTYLEEQGYVAKAFLTLAEARQHLATAPLPDLIVLDVMLKDGNGLIFIRELRRTPKFEHIPVIMMSALRNKSQDRVAGLEFGADDYMGKPFDLKELELRIEKIFKNKKNSTEGAASASPAVLVTPPTAQKEIILDAEPESELRSTGETEEPSSVPLWTVYLSLLLRPRTFFRTVSSDVKHHLGWFSMGVAAMGFAFQLAIEDKSFGTAFVGSVAFFIGFLALTATTSWGIQWGLGLKRVSVAFSDLMMVAKLAVAPVAVSAVLGLIYVLGAGGRFAELTASPLLIFPSLTASNSLGYILRRLDVFELWSILLFVLGLVSVLKIKKRKVALLSFGIWFLVIALYGFVRRWL